MKIKEKRITDAKLAEIIVKIMSAENTGVIDRICGYVDGLLASQETPKKVG